MKIPDKELREIFARKPGTLTREDLRWLRPDQLERLSLHQVAGLSCELLLAMTAKQIGGLTQEQVAVLSLEQMGLVPAAKRKQHHTLKCVLGTDTTIIGETREEKLASIRRAEIAGVQWRIAILFWFVLPLAIIIHKLKY